MSISFNTVNGKYCCNLNQKFGEGAEYLEFQYRKR